MKELVGHGLVVHERANHQKGSFWVGNLFFDNVWHLARYVSAHTLFLLSHMPCSCNCSYRWSILFLFPGVSHACLSVILTMFNYLNVI